MKMKKFNKTERKVGLEEGFIYIQALGNETFLRNHIAYFEKKLDKEIEPYIKISFNVLAQCPNFAAWIRLNTELICNKLVWSLHRAIGEWDNLINISFRNLQKTVEEKANQKKAKHKFQNLTKALFYVVELRNSIQHGGMPNPMPSKRRKVDDIILYKMTDPKHYRRTKKIFSYAYELLELLPKTVIGLYDERYFKEN